MPILNMVYYAAEWGWGWWQPWANTIAYLPMKTDLLDHSGTWTTATVSWTVSLESWHWYFNGGKIYGTLSSIPTSYTISMWIKATSLPSHWETLSCIWQYNTYSNFWLWLNNTDKRVTYSRRDVNYPPWPIVDTTNWYLVTITYGSWTVALYINWTYSTGTTSFPTTALWTSDYIIADNTGANFYWYINDYILEDKVRTAQEISDYYNQTKANYWL